MNIRELVIQEASNDFKKRLLKHGLIGAAGSGFSMGAHIAAGNKELAQHPEIIAAGLLLGAGTGALLGGVIVPKIADGVKKLIKFK